MEAEEQPPFLPTSSSMASAEKEEQGAGRGFLCSLLCLSFVISLVRAIGAYLLWAGLGVEGKGGACNAPPSRGPRTMICLST